MREALRAAMHACGPSMTRIGAALDTHRQDVHRHIHTLGLRAEWDALRAGALRSAHGTPEEPRPLAREAHREDPEAEAR